MKKQKHRRTHGMLTSMVKYPKGTPHKKETVWRKVGTWAGGTVLFAALGVMVILLLVMMFKPDMGAATKEGDFQVLLVEESAEGFPPSENVVAAAVVDIGGRSVRIPLRADNREGVEKGRTLHVRYTVNPRVGAVRIESFSLAGEAKR
jgi:hypothetical protein